jgi:hypothetical protein
MKLKYFAAGILTAVMVVFLSGAANSKPKRTQWDYAVFWFDGSYVMQWMSPQKTVQIDSKERDLLKIKKNFSKQMQLQDGFSRFALLNKVGKDGWELIYETEKDVMGLEMYFKRPKQ